MKIKKPNGDQLEKYLGWANVIVLVLFLLFLLLANL